MCYVDNGGIKLNHLMHFAFLEYYLSLCQIYTRVYTPTCSECPMYSCTLGATLCRHNEVVRGVFLKLLWKDDGGDSLLGGGGVTVDQVSKGWVRTIVNGAGVPWFKCTMHKCILYVGWVNPHPEESIHATYVERDKWYVCEPWPSYKDKDSSM